MIVVADSAPLHYLILLEQTEDLPRLYGQVLIPYAVLQELTVAKAPQPVKDWLSQPPSWLRCRSVTSSQLQVVTADLDLGEREAIALAHFLQADLLLIDELAGRAEARRLHLHLTGTLGILRTAAERKMIDVPQVLACLSQTNFYVDPKLIRSTFSE